MKVLSHVAAVVLLVLAVSAAMLVPGDGAAFSDKPPRDSFPPLGTKTVLVTAPLAGQGNRVIFCTLANATSQPVTVTIAGYSSDGTHHIPLGPFVLNPHTADGTFFTPDTGFGYCAFALRLRPPASSRGPPRRADRGRQALASTPVSPRMKWSR